MVTERLLAPVEEIFKIKTRLLHVFVSKRGDWRILSAQMLGLNRSRRQRNYQETSTMGQRNLSRL